MDDQTEENLKSKPTWKRLLYIILYAICFNIAEIVLSAIAVIQFVSALITGTPLKQLQDFGTALGTYIRQLVNFLTYASEEKPFPVGPWPEETPITGGTKEDVIITPIPK